MFDFLAQQEDPTLKIIIGVLFAGIWIFTQVLAAWNERQKKKQRQQNRQIELPPDVIVPPSRQQPPPRRVPPVSAEQAKREKRIEQRPLRQQKQRTGPPPRPKILQAPPPQQPRPPARPAQAQQVFRQPVAVESAAEETPTATKMPAGSLRLRTLLRPKNLRKEFILTEILQPPVSVRAAIDR